MILAAGFGTRLFPLTIDRTKPAIPFLGKPLVGYVAEYVAKFGFQEVVVNLHHQPESVMEALGDGRGAQPDRAAPVVEDLEHVRFAELDPQRTATPAAR